MTPGQLNLIANNERRRSGEFFTMSKTAKNGHWKRFFAKLAIDQDETFKALRDAATGEYHDVECN